MSILKSPDFIISEIQDFEPLEILHRKVYLLDSLFDELQALKEIVEVD